MAKHSHLPKYKGFLNPLFQALHAQIAANSGSDRFFNHIYSLCKISHPTPRHPTPTIAFHMLFQRKTVNSRRDPFSHTERKRRIRIISARKATKKEVSYYEKAD